MDERDVLRVVVIDDHPVVRHGIGSMICDEHHLDVVGEAESGREAVELLARTRPDIALIDLSLGDMNGIEVMAAARPSAPETRFIVLTIYGRCEDIQRAFAGGASGYLLKDAGREELLAAIRCVSAGRRYVQSSLASRLFDTSAPAFTCREQQILDLLVAGKTNAEIAADLGVSRETVKSHVRAVLGKLGVSTRSKAIVVAIRDGIARLNA